MITVLFDGVAYGMLLFLMAVGLSVTMGLMHFINLSHGVFAMVGGYLVVSSIATLEVGFLWGLVIAALGSGGLGLIVERLLFRHFYRRHPLDQVLVSLGLMFVAVAATTYFFGPGIQVFSLPSWLQGQIVFFGKEVGAYRLFLIVIGLTVFLFIETMRKYTVLGARVRAAVDNQKVAEGLGMNVSLLFSCTFAFGCALAGFGGALSLGVLALEPTFAIKYLLFFLMVVAMGGAGTISGPFVAALFVGVVDVAGKYYLPALGAFLIYLLMILLLLWKPHGLMALKK